MKNKTSVNGGVGFFGLLQIAFIVLKLCKMITWSWFWVLSPIWLGMFLLVVCIIFITLILS